MKKKLKINKKDKNDFKKYPLVQINWLDIVSDSSWQSISDLMNAKLPICTTKGHLLSQSNGITRVFSDYTCKKNNNIEEIGNTTLIPNSVIINIKKL